MLPDTRPMFINAILIPFLLLLSPVLVKAELVLGPVEFVQSNGVDIEVPGYSIPSFVPWDGDTLPDLVVGEGGGTIAPGMVRVYRNIGTRDEPSFGDFFYVQSEGVDLVIPGGG